MNTIEKRALTSIGKEPRFRDVLKKLTLGEEIEDWDKVYILATAMILIRRYQEDRRYTSFADLAYYIILKYSLQHADYTPLYDYAVNFGFYPIARELLHNGLYKGNPINDCLGDLQLDSYRNADEATLTLEQYLESSNFLRDSAHEACYLAPTSFGKSSLIVDYIQQLGDNPCRIVVIVPTKSLLVQTLQMIRSTSLRRKILVHDEMYDGEQSFIAVFTQERAMRLLMKHVTCFDLIVVDEAHNLLKGDSRSIILSRVLRMNLMLNPNHRVLYLSPLVQDADNLRLANNQNISSHVIKFNVKEPEIFELRLNKELYQYNWPATTTLPYQRQLDFPINRCYWRLSDLRLKEGFYDYTGPKSEEANGRISEDREVMQGRLAGGLGSKDSKKISESGEIALSDESRAYLEDKTGSFLHILA